MSRTWGRLRTKSPGSSRISAHAERVGVMTDAAPSASIALNRAIPWREEMADPARVHPELVGGHHVEVAWPGQPHLHDLLDAPGTGRHDDDAVGEKGRLGNGVGDEHDGLARLLPDAQELE